MSWFALSVVIVVVVVIVVCGDKLHDNFTTCLCLLSHFKQTPPTSLSIICMSMHRKRGRKHSKAKLVIAFGIVYFVTTPVS